MKNIAATPLTNKLGAWNITIDFTDGAGTTTPSVVVDNLYLERTPLVAVTHGWKSGCTAMTSLMSLVRGVLKIPVDHVQCYPYTSENGVREAACGRTAKLFNQSILTKPGFGPWLTDLQATDVSQPVIHVVAHSLGGLVARYYSQRCREPGDPTIATIAMLGTPNLGAEVAAVSLQLCPWDAYLDPLGFAICVPLAIGPAVFGVDPHSQAIEDLAPGSSVLHDLNENFTPPLLPTYRAHIGRVDTLLGFFTSNEFENDCFIGQTSVQGPGRVFAANQRLYDGSSSPALSHAAFSDQVGCSEPTLTDDSTLATNVARDIKGDPLGTSPGGSAPVAATAATSGTTSGPMIDTVQSVVQPGEITVSNLQMPAGLTNVGVLVSWLDADQRPMLNVTLRRPDGTVAMAGNPDVAGAFDTTPTSSLGVLSKGFQLVSPVPGAWTMSVQGASVPPNGSAYLIRVMPASNVGLAVTVSSPTVRQGQVGVITARLLDGDMAVTPSSINAVLTKLDYSQVTVPLRDDGVSPDQTAGDKLYSGSLSSTPTCGTFRIKATATGSTSEGIVSRVQFSSYEVNVADDAIRDPCNSDDDADGLTDDNELTTRHTDPLNPDSDGDGYTDGREVTLAENPLTYCNIMRADVDGDGAVSILDLTLLATRFTQAVPPAPARYDQDGDNAISILDLTRIAQVFVQRVSACP